MSFRENVSSDSGQIEKARQDLLLACREAADRVQQEQERQREQKQKQEQKQISFFEAPQKPQETLPELNSETTQAADEESVITIEQAATDETEQSVSYETEQSVPTETGEISPTVQTQRQKIIPSYRNHNPFVEDILKRIVSEDIDRLRRQLADKP